MCDTTAYLQSLGCSVLEKEPLSAHTSFKIGGAADWLVTVKTKQQAVDVLQFCHKEKLPVFFLGNGSNLLVSDHGVEGVVLRVNTENALAVNGTEITVGADVLLSRLCRAAYENGLTGLEFAYGIPGTVGGGTYMNAGAYGGQLSDVIVSATVLTKTGEWQEIPASEMEFDYRHSMFMKRPLLIWSVTLRLQKGNSSQIKQAMEQHIASRKEKQPLEYPSGGSFFKRPSGHFAGALIEQCGLKGATVGGAQISEKHAGFLINRGGATCADVMALCRQVQEEVQERFGVRLEREVQFIGRQ
ncbi:MAG: UDP-N-acetylmuramate dehydrogenase [Clostridia bacterium]|nr:UDP-N-acetylmuramate dehydrogenase [Clostridia bacterium]